MPAGFVDAATVVEGLVVDMRYFGTTISSAPDRRLRGAALPVDAAGRGGARPVQQRSRPAGFRAEGVRLLPADACGGAFRALGARPQGREAQGRVLPRRRQARSVPARLYLDRSGHSRGSTVDLTLVRLGRRAGQPAMSTWARGSISSARSHGRRAGGQRGGAANRELLAAAMRRGGFIPTTRNGGTSRCAASLIRYRISISGGVRARRLHPLL